MLKRNSLKAVLLTAFGVFIIAIEGTVGAAAIPVTAGGLSSSNNTNWLTNGLASFDAAHAVTSGVDWTISGLSQGTGTSGANGDWGFVTGTSQGSLGASPNPQVEWPSPGSTKALGYTLSATTNQLTIGSTMNAHVNADGGILVISEVVPAAGTYTLNSVPQVATAVGQVLQWTSPASSFAQGDTMNFTSTAIQSGTTTYNSGPIGFSAVPEPASLSLIGLGALGLLARRRRLAL